MPCNFIFISFCLRIRKVCIKIDMAHNEHQSFHDFIDATYRRIKHCLHSGNAHSVDPRDWNILCSHFAIDALEECIMLGANVETSTVPSRSCSALNKFASWSEPYYEEAFQKSQLLLRHRADVKAVDSNNKTPLENVQEQDMTYHQSINQPLRELLETAGAVRSRSIV